MAERTLLDVLILLSVVVTAINSAMFKAITTTQPTMIFVNDTQELKVRCGVSSGQFPDITISSITIKFNKTSSISTRDLAVIRAGGSAAAVLDDDLKLKAGAEGRLPDTVTSSYLTLKINKDVKCNDAGLYTCSISITNSSRSETIQSSAEVTGRSYPTFREVIRSPLKAKYAINDVVAVTCWGSVGKPAGSWSWDQFDKEKSLWLPYTTGVTQNDPVLISDCDFLRNSTLRYTVSDLEEKMFRCKINGDTSLSLNQTINGKVSGATPTQLSTTLLFGTFSLVLLLFTR